MPVNLNTILAEIKKNTKQLDELKKKSLVIEKKVNALQKDMNRVLKCVSAENANFKVRVRKIGGGGSSKSAIPMAAKSH